MDTVKISSKYQVVIPRSVRKSLSIKPGQKIQVILYKGHIELIPVVPTKQMRGYLKGIDTTIEREPDRI
jgi:AbrB family looped-hinge helix DNA binding protein